MQVLRDTLRVVETCNGFALYGTTRQGEAVFLAHLGDGVDSLPDPRDPELPEAYGFSVLDLVECPQCAGTGLLFPGATCGMWAGLVPWPVDVQSACCDLCDGAGEVSSEEARCYEQAALTGMAE